MPPESVSLSICNALALDTQGIRAKATVHKLQIISTPIPETMPTQQPERTESGEGDTYKKRKSYIQTMKEKKLWTRTSKGQKVKGRSYPTFTDDLMIIYTAFSNSSFNHIQYILYASWSRTGNVHSCINTNKSKKRMSGRLNGQGER